VWSLNGSSEFNRWFELRISHKSRKMINDFVEHENGVELGCATFRNIQAPQG